jgi:O-antigen ligase
VVPDRIRAGTDDTDPGTVGGYAVGLGAFLLITAWAGRAVDPWAAQYGVLIVLGAAGLPLLVWRALGRGATGPGRTEMWAARAAAGFVAVTAIATALARTPWLAIAGTYLQGTGLVFFVGLAGCWALGTGLRGRDRRFLESALIAGAVVNSVVMVAQRFADLSGLQLPSFSGQPDGLLGNPVFTGAVVAAALVLVAPRFLDNPSLPTAAVVVLLGVGLAITGERLPVVVAALVVAGVLVRARRRHDEPTLTPRSLVFSALVVGGVVVGWLLTLGQKSSLARAAQSSGSETYGDRFHAWIAGIRALGHRPLLGFGPSEYRVATEFFFSPSFVQSHGGVTFNDPHDIFIAVAVSSGLLGLALLGCWLGLGSVRSGPLFWFAAALFVNALVEPLNGTVTPLLFLALGAARWRGAAPGGTDRSGAAGSARWVAPAACVLAVLALVPAGALVVGSLEATEATQDFGIARTSAALTLALRSDTLLFPFSEPASLLAQIDTYRGLDLVPAAKKRAAYWASVASARDPDEPTLLFDLANQQVQAGQFGAAQSTLARAHTLQPLSTSVDNLLGILAYTEGRHHEARTWWRRSLAITPHQPLTRAYLDGTCPPPDPAARGFGKACTFTTSPT